MALWKDFRDLPDPLDWYVYFMHLGSWAPIDNTSCHVFGYSYGPELPVGVAGWSYALTEAIAAEASLLAFALANRWGLSCSDCKGFGPGWHRPHLSNLTQARNNRAFATPEPYYRQLPPALYAGRIIYYPDIDIPASFWWDEWPRQ